VQTKQSLVRISVTAIQGVPSLKFDRQKVELRPREKGRDLIDLSMLL
jgi:hypothetical protein